MNIQALQNQLSQIAKTEIEIEEQEEPVEEPGIFIRTWNMMRDGFSHLWDVLFGWLYRSEQKRLFFAKSACRKHFYSLRYGCYLIYVEYL